MKPFGKKVPAYRIVLADDQKEVRGALRRFIERDGGFEVVAEAANGTAAIEAVERFRPDAMVLDLAMPGLDGLATLEEIMRFAPSTKVVVLSSMVPFNGTQEKAMTLGAVAAFDKYTSPKKVIKALAKCLSDCSQEASV